MSAEPLGSRYVLDQQIGQGGMGVVWRGRDRTSGAVVAIKVLRPELAGNGTVVSRFVQERTVLTQIRHHNIVAVLRSCGAASGTTGRTSTSRARCPGCPPPTRRSTSR
jgi:serine/threonine protein kinase